MAIDPEHSVRPKRRSQSHLQGETGITVTVRSLPKHWVTREISPDYGLDLHIETFAEAPDGDAGWDALGEHFFAQVKTVSTPSITTIQPFANKESTAPHIDNQIDSTNQIEVLSYSLEVEEIETVRRMGSAIPVLLIVVDTDTMRPYYICLTDWISKILPTWRPQWRSQKKVVVHLPTVNRLSDPKSWSYLSTLAKRPKLYGAFQQFSYYSEEISHATNAVDIAFEAKGEAIAEVRHLNEQFDLYYSTTMDLDIWGTEVNPSIGLTVIIKNHLDEAKELLESISGESSAVTNQEEFLRLCGKLLHIEGILKSINSVSKTYEKIVRNWHLPTELGCTLR